jgi:WS/DGAT/MGAT family acyltransferase
MPSTDASSLTDRFPNRMNPSDAVLWDIEEDPVLRSTITAVAVLDRTPDWDRLRRRIDYASRIIPRLRQRAMDPPMRLGPPRWVVDPDFDLDYHLRRVQVPAPGTLREVFDLAEPISMEAFDRQRPLWEFTLVEGLEGDRAALVQKVHHTVTDGIGGIELALAIVDDARDAPEPALPPPPPPGSTARPILAVGAAGDVVGRALHLAARTPGLVLRGGLSAAIDPIGRVRRAGDVAGSVARILAPVPQSRSTLLRGRSLNRRFETVEVPMADLRAAAHAAGGTANDVFLAAVVEGLRRYHERHEAPVEELRVTMPVSFRHEGDDLGGNRFTPVRFAVPVVSGEPADRIRAVGALARRWIDEPAIAYTDVIAEVLDRLPVPVTTSILGAMLKHVDTVVTNVPGFPSRAYLTGAEIEREYAFAPPSGAAMNVALLSHVDTACIGVVTDPAAVPDEDVLLECLIEGFDDALRVAGHQAVRTA